MDQEGTYLFSIIVPVYNVEAYLKRCMDSLLGQMGAQILLVDDGSTDGSGGLCEEYASKYAHVECFHKSNGGLSSARNYGIERASGEYLVFVDSDDFVEETMCECLWKAMEPQWCVDVIAYDALEQSEVSESHLRRIRNAGIALYNGHDFLLGRYRQRNMNVQAWMYAYRKAYLDRYGLRFKEGILHEDVEFTPRALLPAERILEVPDVLYHYMVRENSISTTKDKTKNIQDLFATLQELEEFAGQQDEELCRWMRNNLLDSYLNMIYDAKMYSSAYKRYVDKGFLRGKAATGWNRMRVGLCLLSVRLYCLVNAMYKRVRS